MYVCVYVCNVFDTSIYACMNVFIHACTFFLEPSMTDYIEETGSLLARLRRSKNEPGVEFFLVL